VITAGLGGLVMAVLCGVGFVASTARADGHLPAGATSGFAGAPRAWALAATLLAVASLLLLAGGVFG
jgi:hypothetical protein